MKSVKDYIIICIVLTTSISQAFSQDTLAHNHSFSIAPFQGFIYQHTPEVGHLITGQPRGVILSLDKHTYGAKSWESRYNFPDTGYSLYYLDYGNSTIGKTIAIMPYYNFYFNKNRQQHSNFVFKMAFGLGYNTNPYQRVHNNKNNFLGSHISFGTQLEARYEYQISARTGLEAGMSVIHFSNASIKRPNKGVNVVAASVGLKYALTDRNLSYHKSSSSFEKEPIRFHIALSVGASEVTTIGGGSHPFYVVHGYAQKKTGHKSGLQLGTDFFITQSIREDIRYDPTLEGKRPDYKRVGVFIGHEWYINRLSLVTQFGYYAYRPYDSFKPVYQRINLKYYIRKSLFAGFSLKTHFAKAEAAEFGIGVIL